MKIPKIKISEDPKILKLGEVREVQFLGTPWSALKSGMDISVVAILSGFMVFWVILVFVFAFQQELGVG